MMKDILIASCCALAATGLILSLIVVVGISMDKKSCSSYGEVTNTKVYYDLFSGCYIKKGYNWYLLESYRIKED